MNIVDLDDHVNSNCPRSRYCNKCSQLFDSIAALEKHYKLECPHVEIQCSDCNKVFPRDLFRRSSHPCYKAKLHTYVKSGKSPIGFFMFLIFSIVAAVVAFRFFIDEIQKNEQIHNLKHLNDELLKNWHSSLTEIETNQIQNEVQKMKKEGAKTE